MRTLVPVVVLVLVVSGSVAAQSREPSQRVKNALVAFDAGEFGVVGLGVGDFDGDGFGDYAVAAPSYQIAPGNFSGRVYLYSGRTSLLIKTFDGEQSSSDFGKALADAGDADGDGTRDLAITSRNFDSGGFTNNGRVAVYSGATGLKLWSVDGAATGRNLGESLAALADQNGDGAHELVVGEPGYAVTLSGQGRVRFLDGATGASLGAADGPIAFAGFGKLVAARPDASLVFSSNALGGVYEVGLPVGGTSSAVLSFPAPPGASLRARVALVKAPSGGGFRVVVGRQLGDVSGTVNCGTVELFAVGGALPIMTFAGAAMNEGVGTALSAVADADGDGIEEIVFTSGVAGSSILQRIRVGTQAGTVIDDVVRSGSLGAEVSTLPDVTGDGRGEWLQFVANGVSLTYEADLFARGLTLASAVLGPTDFVATFAIDCGVVNAGATYLQLYGFSGASPGFAAPPWPLVPLNPDDTTNVVLGLVGTPFFPDALGALDGLGTKTTTMSIPAPVAATLSGLTGTTTVVVLGPGGLGVVAATPPAAIPFP